jgi:tripartite-type tricarboxylate transporter receptor subunit TctC
MILAVLMSVAASPTLAEGASIPSKITLAIGTNAGGGYDLYGRLVARHIGRFLPNNPSLIPTNMPGAGQLIMTNWLHNVAPKDGSAIGLVPSSTAFEKLFGNPRAQYDARAFNWIGSLNGYYTVAVVWHSSAAKSAQDLFKRETVIGGGAPASDVTIWPKLLNNILGTKLKIVSGYVGTAKISMALESGEVEGMVGADWDGIKLSRPAWVRDKLLRYHSLCGIIMSLQCCLQNGKWLASDYNAY